MSIKTEKARCYFKKGYNCSQSVVLSFQDEINIEQETLLKLASSFGAGMGRMREVCGAVSGMFIVAGLLYGYSSPCDKESKTMHYKRIQELAKMFREKNNSIICKELLGVAGNNTSPIPSNRTESYYKKRPCIDLVSDAVSIMEDYIESNN